MERAIEIVKDMLLKMYRLRDDRRGKLQQEKLNSKIFILEELLRKLEEELNVN